MFENLNETQFSRLRTTQSTHQSAEVTHRVKEFNELGKIKPPADIRHLQRHKNNTRSANNTCF